VTEEERTALASCSDESDSGSIDGFAGAHEGGTVGSGAAGGVGAQVDGLVEREQDVGSEQGEPPARFAWMQRGDVDVVFARFALARFCIAMKSRTLMRVS
jgi:hypothetical protein